MKATSTSALVFRVGGTLCALPLSHVVETMRPQPTEAVAGAPRCVRGLAIVRGTPVPVVDAACLLGEPEAHAGRFIMLELGPRNVALAVGSVQGVRAIPDGALRERPPLISEGAGDVVSAIGRLDGELLLVLQDARILPEDAWASLALAQGAA